MAYGESNGYVIDDVASPGMVKVVAPLCLGLNVSKTASDAI